MYESQDEKRPGDDTSEDNEEEEIRKEGVAADPRFNQPPPSPWKRLALILFIGILFYFAFRMRAGLQDRKSKVVYASRYSKEYKFRPAASPVITETLKDGRTRLRGATPTPTPTPTPTSTAAKKRRRPGKAGRAGGKAKRR